jgi:hypothetical protein
MWARVPNKHVILFYFDVMSHIWDMDHIEWHLNYMSWLGILGLLVVDIDFARQCHPCGQLECLGTWAGDTRAAGAMLCQR